MMATGLVVTAICLRMWDGPIVQVQLHIKKTMHTFIIIRLSSWTVMLGVLRPNLGKQVLFMDMNNGASIRISLIHVLMEIHINILKY